MEERQGQSFQFHKGTIRTQIEHGNWMSQSYFNSIKVQLERRTTSELRNILSFQFHKGTIRTSYRFSVFLL